MRKALSVAFILLSLSGSMAALSVPTKVSAQSILDSILPSCPAGSTAVRGTPPNGGPALYNDCVQNGTVVGRATLAGYIPTDVTCSGTSFNPTTIITCAWRAILSSIGAGAIWIVSWLVVAAGMLFNWAIGATITNFAGGATSFFNPSVSAAVANVWTTFRDVSNILIIGFFVFIAISIILGLHEYGQKKMIARVLIVATLINFSFLFTTIAINASNYIASQFLQTRGLVTQNDQNGAITTTVDSSKTGNGIAQQFLHFAGAETFGDTLKALGTVADSTQSAWVALLHGIVVALLLFLAAITLLYGAFILMARAVILIFLLMTAALAFASYLMPSLAGSQYGWTGWWSALLRNAFLAPALGLFLWATINIAKALETNNGGTLGSLITDPTASINISALFNYFIVMGLLFAAIQVSNSLAGTASRFAIAGITWPAGAAARFGIAPVARRIIGRGAAVRAEELGEHIKEGARNIALMPKDDPRRAKAEADLARLIRDKEKATAASKRTYDLMNTGAIQRLGKALGMPESLVKGTKTNYADTAHKQVEEATKQAIAAAVGEKDAKKIAEEVHKTEGDQIRGAHDDARAALKTAREAAEAAKSAGQLEERLAEHRQAETDAIIKRERAQQAHDTPGISPAERQAHANEIAAQTQNIQNARNAAAPIAQRISELNKTVKPFQDAYAQTHKDVKEFEQKVSQTTKRISAQSSITAQNMAGRVSGSKFTQVVRDVTGVDLDPYVSREARAKVRKRAAVIDKVTEKKEVDSAAKGDSHTAPASPPASGTAAPGH